MIALLLLLVGCGDPELSRIDDALETYRDGRAHLAAGRPDEAALAFEAAAALDPQSPALLAWQAHALVEAGDLPAALALLGGGLERFPDAADLRYNRAALRARSGDADGAAADLRYLYDKALVSPLDAGRDPDFAALQAHPDAARLVPKPALEVTARGEQGAVLLGETWVGTFALSHPSAGTLEVRLEGADPGLLRHVRTVEDVTQRDAHEVRRTLEVTWRAVAAGQGTLGPWQLAAGGAVGRTPALAAEVVAVGAPRDDLPAPSVAFSLPSAALSGIEAPAALVWEGQLLVVTDEQIDGRLEWTLPPADPSPVWLELREGGQPQKLGALFASGGEGEVVFSRNGAEVLRVAVPPRAP